MVRLVPLMTCPIDLPSANSGGIQRLALYKAVKSHTLPCVRTQDVWNLTRIFLVGRQWAARSGMVKPSPRDENLAKPRNPRRTPKRSQAKSLEHPVVAARRPWDLLGFQHLGVKLGTSLNGIKRIKWEKTKPPGQSPPGAAPTSGGKA